MFIDVLRHDMDAIDAIDDSSRIFNSGQYRVVLRGTRVLLQFQVRVQHWAFKFSTVGSPEERGEPKVLALCAPFVVERSLIRCDHTSTALDKLLDLIALRS